MWSPPDLAPFACRIIKAHERMVVLEVTSPNHREFFSVAEGDRTLAVTVLDVTNVGYREPRLHVIEKPPEWRHDGRAEELLLLIWNALLPG